MTRCEARRQPEDAEQLGARSGVEGVEAPTESALELVGPHGRRLRRRSVASHTPCRYGLPERLSAALPTAPTEVASGHADDAQDEATPGHRPPRHLGRPHCRLVAVTAVVRRRLRTIHFSSGLPLRYLISFLLVWGTNAVVVVVGILYLRRDRVGVAGGLFLAAALTVAIAIIEQVLQTAPHFGRWQTDLVLVLEIIEGGLLALAATRAIGVRAANDLEAGQ
jgi:hypothetical protein